MNEHITNKIVSTVADHGKYFPRKLDADFQKSFKIICPV